MSPGSHLLILAYHRFSAKHSDRLTVSRATFERQLDYLKARGYRTLRLSELLRMALPEHGGRYVAITFDDGYESVADIAVPALQRHAFSATCFLPVGLIGAENAWDGGGLPLMSEATLRALPRECVEFALHSWQHESYCGMTPEEITRDVVNCRERLDALEIPYVPILAYPYGRVPKNDRTRQEWRRALHTAGIHMACRVGNRLNRLPPRDALMLTRTNIHGDEGHLKFRIKVAFGRCKLL